MREFEKAIALKPDFAEAQSGLGSVLAQRGKLAAAIPHLAKAVELDPKNAAARANLCLALSLAYRPLEAIPHAEAAVDLTKGQDPVLLDMLGRLDGQAGRLADAADAARRAIDVASRAGDERLVRELRERLAAYESAAAREAASGSAPAARTPSR